jgi:polyferredoxin
VKKLYPADKIRRPVQIFFFVLIALIAVNHTLSEAGKSLIPWISGASLHAVCPFGGIVTVYELMTAGRFVQKIHESSLVLATGVFLSAIFIGPAFCGWICPFGSIQEFFSWIGKKLFKKRFGKLIPAKLDRVLVFFRYIVLAGVVVLTAYSTKLVFQEVDPYYALFQFWTGEVAITAYIVLGTVLLLSLITERPWCRYACPYGAFLGLTNLFRIIPIRKNPSKCISCGKCDRECPVGIEVSSKTVIRDHRCISCLKCTSDAACPIPETVSIKAVPYTDYKEKTS